MSIAGLLMIVAAPLWAASPTSAGDVTLTEFQADTQQVPDFYGEWIELYNNYPGTVDFYGVTVTNAAGQSITIDRSILVGRGDYLVLGVSDDQTYDSTNPLDPFNGNVPVDYVYAYSSFDLRGSGDTLTISYAGTTLDTVKWTSSVWGVTPDAAHAASLNAFDLEWANDFATSWCSSGDFITVSGMYGSPGAENDYCGTAAGTDNDGDGYSEREGDCRDDEVEIHPDALDGNDGVPQSAGGGGDANDDADCDGVRDDGVTDDDGDGYTEVDGDCDDDDGDVFPGGREMTDGTDNDCNGCVDDIDSDGDGYGYSDAYACGSDCSPSIDGSASPDLPPDADATVYPGAVEVPYDGYDQDCDGLDLCDYDLDGYKSEACDCGSRCDCDDNNPDVHPGSIEVDKDGIDNDCNGDVDVPDRDGDGVTEADGDCMDIGEPADQKEISATVSPNATEICGDLLDNDCDGFYDNLPSCTNPAAYATARGGGLCGIAPAAGTTGAAALGILMGMAAVARRREGGAR